jgi:hypothetical protein
MDIEDFTKDEGINKMPIELNTGKLFIKILSQGFEHTNLLQSILKNQLMIRHLLKDGSIDADKVDTELHDKLDKIVELSNSQFNEYLARITQ